MDVIGIGSRASQIETLGTKSEELVGYKHKRKQMNTGSHVVQLQCDEKAHSEFQSFWRVVVETFLQDSLIRMPIHIWMSH